MPTLLDIMLDCSEELGEYHGTPMHRDPPPASTGGPSRPWERHLRETMDEVCETSFCYYTTINYDVTINQSQLVSGSCFCPIFRIEEARIADPYSGTGFSTLDLVTPEAFPHCPYYWGDWRNYPGTGTPRALVIAGQNNLRLYGMPLVTSLASAGGGVLVTGYATTNGTKADGSPLIALDSEFPLPFRAIKAVKAGAKWRRMKQYRREFSTQERAEMKSEYDDLMGLVNSESRTQSRANAAVGAWI